MTEEVGTCKDSVKRQRNVRNDGEDRTHHCRGQGEWEMKRKITKTIGRRSCYTPISQSYLSSFIENLEPHSLSIPFLHVVCPFEAHKNILSHQTIPHSEVPYIVSDPQPLVQRPNLHPYQCVSIDKLRLLFSPRKRRP